MAVMAAGLCLSFKMSAQVPTAAFTLNQATLCAGSNLVITDASTDAPATWTYNIEGPTNTVTTLQSPTIMLTAGGDYSITLIAGNVNGESAPVTHTFVIKSLPVVSGGSSVQVCAGEFVTLSGSGAISYTWTGGALNGVPFPPSTTNVYTVTGVDADGCEGTATVPVTVNPLPAMTVNGSASVCVGTAVTLTVTGADTYSWSVGGNGDNISDNPLVTTTYSVTGMNSVTSCTSIITKQVIVNALPPVFINSGTVCAGVIFTLSPGGASSYIFSNGSNTVAPLADASYTVTGTDANGCSATAVSEVTVKPLPVISVTGGTICAGTVFTINPTGASTYTYLPGLSQTVSPGITTTYTVTGTDIEGCVSVAAVTEVTVFANPVITVNSGTVCAGNVFTMTPGNGVSYSFSNGSSTVVPTGNTTYTVTGTDANGCVNDAVSSVTMVVLPVVTVNSGTLCAGSVFTMVPQGASTYTFVNGTATVNPIANTSYSVHGSTVEGCMSVGYAVSDLTVHALPSVTVNSGTICAGKVFTMVPQGANSYTFVNGSATVNPITNTSYSVHGSSVEGCISVGYAVSDITVHALPVVTVTSGSICLNDTYTIVASGAASYTFEGGTAVVSPASTTSYTVTGISALGCASSNTAIATVTVHALPLISVASPTAVCEGSATTLTVSGASTYTWNVSNSNLSNYTVTPLTSTTYTVFGTDANGCINFTTQTVAVNSLPTITVNSGTICPGASFTMVPSGALNYNYSSGSAIVAPASTSSYSIFGTDMNGCVSALPAVSTVSVANALTITVTGNTTICEGKTTSLTASGATSFSWTATILTSTISVNPVITTTYIVTGITAGCSKTAAVTVSVNALPVVTVSSSSTLSCLGESVTITSGGASTYSWDNGANTASILVSPAVNTTYTVTGTDVNSCVNTATITQNVSDCTGLSKYQSAFVNVGVYPNPTGGEFTLALTGETSVKILNGIGQVIYVNQLQGGNNLITLNDQPKGIYFVQLTQHNQTKTVKVVKN